MRLVEFFHTSLINQTACNSSRYLSPHCCLCMLSCKKVTLRVGVVGFHSTWVSRERRIYSITTWRSAWNCLRLCRSTEVRVYLSFQRAETRAAALSWCLRQSRGEVCWPLCMLHRRKELFRSEKARWGKMGWDGSLCCVYLSCLDPLQRSCE